MIKNLIRAALRNAGYDLAPHPRAQVIPPELPDAALYAGPEDFSRLFRPWKGREFDRWFTPAVLKSTMLSRKKLYLLLQLFRQTLDVQGDIFEAGVASGGSARLMLDVLRQAGKEKRMWLLDTFEGYQKVDAARDGQHVQINQCRGDSKEQVAELLRNDSVKIHLIAGLIPGTLAQVETKELSFAHIDVNLHEPTRAATAFCLERLQRGGIILFDDYSWPATFGARLAIDEVCGRDNIVCIPESTQSFLIKR